MSCGGPGRGGVTILLTGLSGAGKSTIAAALRQRAIADGRTISWLDGDAFRKVFSGDLGFKMQDRRLNLFRMGYIAAEIMRHGGVVIISAIAPYAADRRDIRALADAVGRFMLVYVATPLDVCEARDSKGLYARARSGSVATFTGISDPYESPDDADIVVNTAIQTTDEIVGLLAAYLDAMCLSSGSAGVEEEGSVPAALRG